ncbi:MAG TPA: zf-HC2 domain-containing protein [Terriglobia bacterium]|nr:zf-HC2 domain-containing protein [Terriglobia bacterium]
MTHLELENLISDFLEGQLDAAPRAEFEAHAAECTPCNELVAGVRRAMELCQSAEELDPAPWLVSKIMLSTVGQRKPTFGEQLAAYFRPAARVRLAYAVAMAVFSFSIIVNTAGINLRQITLADLNPRTWLYQANRTGHLVVARAEKFYYDLRVVYEIESRLRQFRQQSGQEGRQPEKIAPKPETPAGGTTDSAPPGNPELAQAQDFFNGPSDLSGSATLLVRLTRSTLR